jgi:hypothetical protein
MASDEETIPYFILRLEDGRTKALFTVPTQLVHSLIVHPILCRGASFELRLYTGAASRIASSSASPTTFLSTDYFSPHPEETAHEISRRLASRVEDNDSFQISSVLGL